MQFIDREKLIFALKKHKKDLYKIRCPNCNKEVDFDRLKTHKATCDKKPRRPEYDPFVTAALDWDQMDFSKAHPYKRFEGWMAKRMLAMPIAGAVQAIEYYQEMIEETQDQKDQTNDYRRQVQKKEVAYISELDLRKVLGSHLISPGDKGDEVDLLEVFVAQLPHTLKPGFDSFFRRFRVDDVKESLLSILKGASSMSRQAVPDDDDEFARQATFADEGWVTAR